MRHNFLGISKIKFSEKNNGNFYELVSRNTIHHHGETLQQALSAEYFRFDEAQKMKPWCSSKFKIRHWPIEKMKARVFWKQLLLRKFWILKLHAFQIDQDRYQNDAGRLVVDSIRSEILKMVNEAPNLSYQELKTSAIFFRLNVASNPADFLEKTCPKPDSN